MTIMRILLTLLILPRLILADEVLHITSTSPKPLQDICLELADKLHWRIGYEDPPVLAQDELRMDLERPGMRRLAMRAVALSVDVPTADSNSVEAKHAVMKSVIDRYNHSGNRAVFHDLQPGDLIHVVPVAVRNEAGKLQPFEPMLNTPVTIMRGTYSLGALVEEIMTQVSQKRGIQVVRATVPINIFAQTTVTEEAYDEPARDVLVRAFEEINGPRLANHDTPLRLTWYLLYNPNGRHYFLNIRNVLPEGEELSPTPGKQPAPSIMEREQTAPRMGSKSGVRRPN